jgi:class 3 adenylate cyclase/tetratricopeptide (TPR) repeat protein
MQAHQTVTELMEMRAQIDQELHQCMSQTLCLLLADVAGSTAFFQKHGDVQGRLFVQRHHHLVTPCITACGGKVIKTVGDAVMASFETPESGLDCAIDIQHKLWEARTQDGMTAVPQTKISLHYGQGLVEPNDIYGDLVNSSARLNGMAEADQIVISQTVYERVKDRQDLSILPLSTFGWKEGEKGIPVYEVLWQQQAEAEGKAVGFRSFEGGSRACFYCGLSEHPMRQCPSKQLTSPTQRLEHLGYQPLTDILRLFQNTSLSAPAGEQATSSNIGEAFYEISLPYQLRFLPKVWLAAGNEDWHSLERKQMVAAHPLAGTRLWMGMDCLRVGRYDQAKDFLHSTLESNPGDYKPHVGLGFLALEKDDPFTALQHWRKGLQLTKTSLQTAYVHLLIHRLYDLNGKTQLAYQENQKALDTDRYLYEARYRQLALMSKETGGEDILTRLRKLIQDDRSVYVKVMLDPAFASLRERLYTLLTTICQEARTEALARLPQVTEELTVLRAWYPQPAGEILAIERTLDRLRQHLKSESYFGYHDAIHEGAVLQTNIARVLERRKTSLQRDYALSLASLEEQLTTLSHTALQAQQPQFAGRITQWLHECARLRSLTSFGTAAECWRAWGDLQQLKAAVRELAEARTPGRQQTPQALCWALLPYAVGGGVVASTTLFGIFGYLVYFTELELTAGTLLLSLIGGGLGGVLLGSAIGWLVQRYRARR